MKRLAFLSLAVSLMTGATAFPGVTDLVHFGLRSSSPAADATVAAVEEIRLTFTQVPQENSATIRLVNAGGDLVETGELQSDPNDATTVFVAVGTALAHGRHTVAWRGIGDDGHVVRGDFGFTVAAQR
jgi:methionine-rich copper-binding protein CopC